MMSALDPWGLLGCSSIAIATVAVAVAVKARQMKGSIWTGPAGPEANLDACKAIHLT